MLCDIAAAELLFPAPWFSSDAAAVVSASALGALATTYRASRDATVRRYAEVSTNHGGRLLRVEIEADTAPDCWK